MSTTKSILVNLLLSFLAIYSYAQSTTSSPYSIYGIGDMQSSGFATNLAMGDIKYSLSSISTINVANPASYSNLRFTTYEVGFNNVSTSLRTNGASQSNNDGYISYVAFGAAPKLNRWGMSFGLMPYSKMGYDISSKVTTLDLDTIEYYYQGQGGLRKVYFGNAINIFQDTVHQLSVGVNASFLFGNFQKSRRVLAGSNSGFQNSRYTTTTYTNDYDLDFGLQYKRKIKDKTIMTIGATYSPGGKKHSTANIESYTFTGTVATQVVIDSILNKEETGYIVLPAQFGGGISIDYDSRLTLALEYSQQQWSDYSWFNNTESLKNAWQVSFGGQYMPTLQVGKFFENIKYRFGTHVGSSRVSIQNENVNIYGIAFGVGLPLWRSNSLSRVNLGFDLGQRGSNNNGLIAERYSVFTLGITINPNYRYDGWFVKRKLD